MRQFVEPSLRRARPFACAISTLLLVVGTGVGASGVPQPYAEPYVAARGAIVALVGEDFFERFVTPESAVWNPPDPECGDRAHACPEAARLGFTGVQFRLRMPEHSFVDVLMRCMVSPDGRVSGLLGAPDCVHDPGKCVFPIDEIDAGKIAEKAGLEPGVENWRYQFLWNHKFRAYIWTVTNTLDRGKDISRGRSVSIDASDGHVLQLSGWTDMF